MAASTKKKKSEGPTNEKSEKALLGVLLKDDQTYWQVSDVIKADHFSVVLHQQIYTAISDLVADGSRISLAALGAKLPDEDEKGQVVAAYLAVLIKNAEDLHSPEMFVDDVVSAYGRRATMKICEKAMTDAKAGVKRIQDVIVELQDGLLAASSETSGKTDVALSKILERVVGTANTAYQQHDINNLPGYDTGLQSLDDMVGRFMAGDFIVLGGAQKEGKTALATQIGRHIAKRDPVLMFQLEMEADEVGRRIIAGEAEMSSSKIQEGSFDNEEWLRLMDAQKALEGLPFHVFDMPGMKLSQIVSRAKAFKRRFGKAGLIIVDHLRKIKPNGFVKDIFERIEQSTGGLKDLAKQIETPVMCLTQRTRSSQKEGDENPQVNDMFGGGSIEQDADILISVFRRDLMLQRRQPSEDSGERYSKWKMDLEKHTGKAEIHLLAHRRKAFPRRCIFDWNGPATKFEEQQRR